MKKRFGSFYGLIGALLGIISFVMLLMWVGYASESKALMIWLVGSVVTYIGYATFCMLNMESDFKFDSSETPWIPITYVAGIIWPLSWVFSIGMYFIWIAHPDSTRNYMVEVPVKPTYPPYTSDMGGLIT